MSKRALPELWGQAEIADYGEVVAARYPQAHPVQPDGRRTPATRVWNWVRQPGFPVPVVRLRMGPVYLASEVRPWLEAHLSKRPKTLPVQRDSASAIADERGHASASAVAARHGVSIATVYRIWNRLPGGIQ